MENWYRLAQSESELTNIALEFRQKMERKYDEKVLTTLCLPVSRALKKHLIDLGFSNAIVVQGTLRIDNPDPSFSEDWDWKDFLPPEPMETEEEEIAFAENAMKETSYTPLHYWVEVGTFIIDITADQFNDEMDDPLPEVIVEPKSNLERYTTIIKDWI